MGGGCLGGSFIVYFLFDNMYACMLNMKKEEENIHLLTHEPIFSLSNMNS